MRRILKIRVAAIKIALKIRFWHPQSYGDATHI